MVVAGSIWAPGWAKLGMAVLTESFRWAAFGLTGATTNGEQAIRIHEAIVFIEGSGLDRALDAFGIEADAATIRRGFKQRISTHAGPLIWSHWLLMSQSS